MKLQRGTSLAVDTAHPYFAHSEKADGSEMESMK